MTGYLHQMRMENVVITRNGTELERLQKNQKNLTNAEVKEFDSRTNIVTNFLSAIDRNMGSDRNGKTWYNEGFSIGCLETRLAYRMGFGDGDASLRSTALNIKRMVSWRTEMTCLMEMKQRIVAISSLHLLVVH